MISLAVLSTLISRPSIRGLVILPQCLHFVQIPGFSLSIFMHAYGPLISESFWCIRSCGYGCMSDSQMAFSAPSSQTFAQDRIPRQMGSLPSSVAVAM